MTSATISHPQFGVCQVLQPYPQFAQDYDSEAITTPIMFTAGGKALDSQAGKPGYNDLLLAGTAVPIGARVQLYIPMVKAYIRDDEVPQWNHAFLDYRWFILWRLRNLFDYRQARIPWHIPRTLGNEDTLEVIIPCIGQPLMFNQTEGNVPNAGGGSVSSRQLTHIKPWEDMCVSPETSYDGRYHDIDPPLVRPMNGGVAVPGTWQQGFPPEQQPWHAEGLIYFYYETQALGDEFLLGVYRVKEVVLNNDDRIDVDYWWFRNSIGNIPPWDEKFYELFSTLVWDDAAGIWVPRSRPGVFLNVGSAP